MASVAATSTSALPSASSAAYPRLVWTPPHVVLHAKALWAKSITKLSRGDSLSASSVMPPWDTVSSMA